jgi:hypothetical protein
LHRIEHVFHLTPDGLVVHQSGQVHPIRESHPVDQAEVRQVHRGQRSRRGYRKRLNGRGGVMRVANTSVWAAQAEHEATMIH